LLPGGTTFPPGSDGSQFFQVTATRRLNVGEPDAAEAVGQRLRRFGLAVDEPYFA
jgi:hypothetical protein